MKKFVKNESVNDESSVDDSDLMVTTPKVMELLFAIRTEVMTSQKQITLVQQKQDADSQKIEEMGTKVNKLSEKLLEPDEGLFARVRDIENKAKQNEERDKELDEAVKHVDKLVDWKSGFAKFSWYAITVVIGIMLKYIFDYVVTKK